MVAALYEDENFTKRVIKKHAITVTGFFQKRKMDQKFLSIDFDSWSELSGSLMAIRKFVQEIKVLNATI